MAIKVPIVSEFQPQGIEKAVKEFQKLETTGAKAGAALKAAFVPATAALVALTAAAGLSLKAAVEDARGQSELERQILASTDATIAQTEATLEFIRAQELASGIASNELRPALAILVRHTGDLSKAQELLALAMDVSVGTGRDVFDVAERMAEGFTGVLTPLEELDYNLVQSIENGASFDDIMNSLADTFGGAVAKDAQTAAGRFERMSVQINQAKIAIGEALLPVLEQLLPTLESMANFIGNNTDLIVTIGAVVGTLAGAIVALNIAMSIYNTVQAITATLNAVLAGSFTALWVATGIGIIVAIIAAIVVLQMKFNILGHAVDALKWVFEQAWGVIKTMINGAIDGINLLIKAINLIPGIDIPELTKFADDVETASERVDYLAEKSLRALEQESKAAHEAIVPLMYSIEGVRRAGDDWESTLGRVNVQTDEFNGGIETATTRLDRFFQTLDRQEAADEFVQTLQDIETQLRGVKEGTAEWEEQQNLAYEALRDLRTERDDLSDAFLEVLKLEIDTGDLERAYTLMANLVNLGGVLDVPSTFQDLPGLGINVPSFADPEGISSSATTVVNVGGITMPAGTNGDDVVRALQDYSRKNGAINVPITDTSRL
jgi:hypothetical protein